MRTSKWIGLLIVAVSFVSLLSAWQLAQSYTQLTFQNFGEPVLVYFILGLLFGLISFLWTSFGKRTRTIVISVAVTLVSLELLLTLFPEIAGRHFASYVHDNFYTVRFYDRANELTLFKPNQEVRVHAATYDWLHTTDQNGFRNVERDGPIDAILLGDSFVYGFGVEFEDTLAAKFNDSEFTATSFAQPGFTLPHLEYAYEKYARGYEHRYVIYFFSINDVDDLYSHFGEEKLKRALEEDELLLDPSRAVDPDLFFSRYQVLGRAILIRPYLYQLVKRAFAGGVDVWEGKSEADINFGFRTFEDELGRRYFEHALMRLNNTVRREGAQLVIAPVLLWSEGYWEALQEMAQINEINLVDTRTLNKKIYFLERDGHFNGTGTQKMVEIVLRALPNREENAKE